MMGVVDLGGLFAASRGIFNFYVAGSTSPSQPAAKLHINTPRNAAAISLFRISSKIKNFVALI